MYNVDYKGDYNATFKWNSKANLFGNVAQRQGNIKFWAEGYSMYFHAYKPYCAVQYAPKIQHLSDDVSLTSS